MLPFRKRSVKTGLVSEGQAQTMRNLMCIVLVLSGAGPAQAQPEVTLFDGKTTSGGCGR